MALSVASCHFFLAESKAAWSAMATMNEWSNNVIWSEGLVDTNINRKGWIYSHISSHRLNELIYDAVVLLRNESRHITALVIYTPTLAKLTILAGSDQVGATGTVWFWLGPRREGLFGPTVWLAGRSTSPSKKIKVGWKGGGVGPWTVQLSWTWTSDPPRSRRKLRTRFKGIHN